MSLTTIIAAVGAILAAIGWTVFKERTRANRAEDKTRVAEAKTEIAETKAQTAEIHADAARADAAVAVAERTVIVDAIDDHIAGVAAGVEATHAAAVAVDHPDRAAARAGRVLPDTEARLAGGGAPAGGGDAAELHRPRR